MKISLTPKLDQLIQDKLATGRHTSAGEVARETPRPLEQRGHYRDTHFAQLKRDINLGLEDIRKGWGRVRNAPQRGAVFRWAGPWCSTHTTTTKP